MTMKKKEYSLKFCLVLLVALTGCGRGYIGTYSGSETVQINGASTQSAVTLVVNEDTGNRVSGTWTGANGSGTFTGTPNGNSLANVNLLVTSPNTTTALGYNYGYNNTYPAYGVGSNYGCSNSYTGSLNLAQDRLSGTLSLTSTTNTATYAYCVNSRSVDVTR